MRKMGNVDMWNMRVIENVWLRDFVHSSWMLKRGKSWNIFPIDFKPTQAQTGKVESMSEGENKGLGIIGMQALTCLCFKCSLNWDHILSEHFPSGWLCNKVCSEKEECTLTNETGNTGWHEIPSTRAHTGPSPTLNVDTQWIILWILAAQ